jgi:hypothetical protein
MVAAVFVGISLALGAAAAGQHERAQTTHHACLDE